MGCQHLDDLYELCVLGTGFGPGFEEVRQHLEQGCPYCLARLREAAQVIYLLSQNVRPVRPSPKSRSELLRRLKKSRTNDGGLVRQ